MKTKVLMLAVTLVGVASFLAFSPVQPVTETLAQNRSVTTSSSEQPATERIELSPTKGTEPDKNIKESRSKNSIKTQARSKIKGATSCRIEIENRTDQTIDIYIDGRFRNTLGPMDRSYFSTATGSPVIYAKAEFEDGTYFYWGPRSFKCGDTAENDAVHFVINP
jgi:hypothetical protein